MALVPHRHLTLRAQRPPEALTHRLAQEVEWVGVPYGASMRPFRGQIDARGFDLVPVLRGRRNSWRPRVLGSVRLDAAGGSAVDVTMRLDPFVTVFMCFFFGFALLMVAILVVVAVHDDAQLGLLAVALWPIAIAAGGYALMMRAFSTEAARVQERFEAICAEPPAGPAYR